MKKTLLPSDFAPGFCVSKKEHDNFLVPAMEVRHPPSGFRARNNNNDTIEIPVMDNHRMRHYTFEYCLSPRTDTSALRRNFIAGWNQFVIDRDLRVGSEVSFTWREGHDYLLLVEVVMPNLDAPRKKRTPREVVERMQDFIMNDETSQPQSSIFSDSRRNSKLVKDNVHGFIHLDQLALKFIDTEEFQRLRDLKQLGVTNLVYPGCVHSRFEHSLGVYHLAGEAVNEIRKYQGLELGIEDFDLQTVKLAGLLHDVGHGPFSHMFESEFIPKVLDGLEWSHEDMSGHLVEYIVDEHNIDIDAGMLKNVQEMIIASSGFSSANGVKEKRFLYDIVANGRNGIDVDKFDYIVRDSRACGLGCSFQFDRLLQTMRVMNDEICYRAKEYLSIYKLFHTRADLHRTVYTHSKVKAIELMVVDAFLKANDHLEISAKIFEPAKFCKLDDTIIKQIEIDPSPALKEAKDLILRIRKRDLYQYCNEFTVPRDHLEHFRKVTAKDIICSQVDGANLNEDDVAVSNIKIDLTRGQRNPLESIKFFQDYDTDKNFTIEDESISQLLPSCNLDRIVRVYSKKSHLVAAVSEAFENFQKKTYGRKTQVHSTPEKMKQKKV